MLGCWDVVYLSAPGSELNEGGPNSALNPTPNPGKFGARTPHKTSRFGADPSNKLLGVGRCRRGSSTPSHPNSVLPRVLSSDLGHWRSASGLERYGDLLLSQNVHDPTGQQDYRLHVESAHSWNKIASAEMISWLPFCPFSVFPTYSRVSVLVLCVLDTVCTKPGLIDQAPTRRPRAHGPGQGSSKNSILHLTCGCGVPQSQHLQCLRAFASSVSGHGSRIS